jgi:hypothetical protein
MYGIEALWLFAIFVVVIVVGNTPAAQRSACRGTRWSGGIWNREKGLSTRIEENYETSTEVKHSICFSHGFFITNLDVRFESIPSSHLELDGTNCTI